MSEQLVVDKQVRENALDPARSFIVQAPAGSGKTGLLIQRYLALLCVAEKPEEILAITFTRKAAAEMRERILSVLSYTEEDSIASDEELSLHDQKTLELAWQAQAQNSSKGWGLLENPNRMQIMTIDAFCMQLVSAMPVASRFGGMPELVDDASVLYQRAITNYFKAFLHGSNSEKSLETILLALNNDFERVSGLLQTLLGRRDQWLPYVTDSGLIELDQMNEALSVAIQQDLTPLTNTLPINIENEIAAMASFAAESLRTSYRESVIRECQALDSFPMPDLERISIWRGLRKLLLTENGSLRTRVTIAEGFPAATSTEDPDLKIRYKQFKDRMLALLEKLSSEKKFIYQLGLVSDIPVRSYSAADQNFLVALFTVLKQVTAELIVEFQSSGTVDFIELNQSALRSLGSDDEPTDLAMVFESRINHILIDEFQDTSRVHMELLRKLTTAWGHQGKSLFVVGDPMQSIYRFRDADVRNFLQIKLRGINSITPEFVQLESNFRSNKNIVDWNNSAFSLVFPDKDNIEIGHIAYSPAQAFKKEEGVVPVTLHTVEDNHANVEAEAVTGLIDKIRKNDPESSIAVLVRSRAQLAKIIPALRKSGITSGLEGMERLSERQEVLDVYSLCMAVTHPADRYAWLSILRAPWCGLDLGELETIATADEELLIQEVISRENVLSGLSPKGRERVNYIRHAVRAAQAMLYHQPLALVIEGLWLRLHGPSCLLEDEQRINVERFFKILGQHTIKSIINSEQSLKQRLHEFTQLPQNSEKTQIQVMTIHMAKGLEFDHVILPGAGRLTKSNDAELLVWQELLGFDGMRHLMLSHYQQEKETPIYNYIRKRNQRLENAEITRLLYVAMTRSIKSIHVFCGSRIKEGQQKIIAQNGSFIKLLQPALATIENQIDHKSEVSSSSGLEAATFSRLIIKTLEEPDFGSDIRLGDTDRTTIAPEFIEYEWASETAMHVGTVVHMALKQLGSGTLDQWINIDPEKKRQHFSRVLKALGIASVELDMAVERTLLALTAATEDKRGNWVLSVEHANIENEYPVSGFIQNEFRNYRIDRTFISRDNVRWIIDYKTSSHMGGSVEAFLDNEMQRYRQQLENYAYLMSKMEDREIKLGLYFPLVQGWREWDYVRD